MRVSLIEAAVCFAVILVGTYGSSAQSQQVSPGGGATQPPKSEAAPRQSPGFGRPDQVSKPGISKLTEAECIGLGGKVTTVRKEMCDMGRLCITTDSNGVQHPQCVNSTTH
jgi:hypothetical protein